MKEDDREYPDDDDRKYIERHAKKAVRRVLDRKCEGSSAVRVKKELRFQIRERVVCNVGSSWASGSVQAINQADPERAWIKLPYVVKIDPPMNRLISAPVDKEDTVCAEVCFRQDKEDYVQFTLFCVPLRHKTSARRFVAGDRVACAISSDESSTAWAAGTVKEVDLNMAEAAAKLCPNKEWPSGPPTVPYLVDLDAGWPVHVHRDEHWLVRDLELQPEGARQAADGTRCLVRIEIRPKGEGWEAVDHQTCKVRPSGPPQPDSDEE